MAGPDRHTAHTGRLSRVERRPEALSTDHFRLDERSEAELIHSATALAGLLTYYDAENRGHGPKPDGQGAWEAFFRHDVTFLLAEIATVDAKAEYRAAQARPKSDLKDLLVADAVRLWSWLDRARELAVFAPPDSLVADLTHTLGQPDRTELSAPPFDTLRARVEEIALPDRGSALKELAATPLFPRDGTADQRATRAFSAVNRATAQIARAAETYLSRALRERRNHPGHLGLFLAFVTLLQKAQVDLNRMTDRHLEFYFRKVLRSAPQAARPDSTHVTFELAAGARPVTLPVGTPLVAGSGAGPEAAIFEIDRAVDVTAARVAQIRSVAVTRNMVKRDRSGAPFVEAVDVYPVANSADGEGAPLPDPAYGWSPFGPGLDAPSHVGFALAAPVLELAGGRRDITLTLSCDPKGKVTVARALEDYEKALAARYEGTLTPKRIAGFLAEALTVSLSTATGWTPVPVRRFGASASDPEALELVLSLPATAPPVSANPAIHPQPVLRAALNPDARVFAYSPIHRLRVAAAEIAVTVTDLTTLQMETDIAPVAPGKPFAPFGPMPLPRARLTVVAPELARKAAERLALTFHWTQTPLPPDTFASHYAAYDPKIREDSFRARLDQSDGADWHPLPVQGPDATQPQKDASLFGLDAAGAVATQTNWQVPHLRPPKPEATPDAPARPDTKPRGALRVELTGPRFGFGQRLFPELLAAAAMAAKPGALRKATAKIVPKKLAKVVNPPPPPAPKPPLLPMLTGVGLSYSATARSDTLGAGDPVELYNLRVQGPMTRAAERQLLRADLNVDGYLMIGLDQAEIPETVSLLFDIRDSLAESWKPGDLSPRPRICWYVLTQSGWRMVPAAALHEDTTRGLTTQGVVEIALPQTTLRTDRFSEEPLVWLSVSLEGEQGRFGQIVDISTHGVRATRRITALPEGAGAPDLHLPAYKITRFLSARPAIAKIQQPVPSSGGRPPEEDSAFRLRLSERLGHKMRAQRPLDYARMLLQEFDQISDVRVLSDDGGGVEVVVAPTRHAGSVSRFPRVPLHLRTEIRDWLAARTSLPVGQIDVRNPAYETIRVQAHLVPRAGETGPSVTDATSYLAGLIAPWMHAPRAPMPIGNARLDVAALLQELRAMPGLEDVLGFSVVHFFRTRRANRSALGPHGFKDSARLPQTAGTDSSAMMLGATPSSVFVPASRHPITILPPRTGIGDLRVGADFIAARPALIADYRQDPAALPLRAAQAGIGTLAIGEDLVLTRPEDTLPPAFAPDTRHHALDAVFLAK